ncbi:hypothetical protein [Emticicia fontis]
MDKTEKSVELENYLNEVNKALASMDYHEKPDRGAMAWYMEGGKTASEAAETWIEKSTQWNRY